MQVYGVGHNNGQCKTVCNYGRTRSYIVWAKLLYRNENNVCNAFKEYEYFHKWYIKLKMHSDKNWVICSSVYDINNKTYNEDSCVLIPIEIKNTLLGLKKKRSLPNGVYKSNNVYRAAITKNKKIFNLGSYDDVESAYSVYKKHKLLHIKELAEKYRDDLDIKVYQKLINYEIEEILC